MNSWRKLQCLSWSERRLLIQALFLLPLTALALRLLGFRRWQAALVRITPLQETLIVGQAATTAHQAQVTAKMVKAAAWHGPYRANCLQQSLVLWWLLRRRAINNDLRIGVRKEGNQLQAHAWIEFQGIPLNDRDDVPQRFAPFNRPVVYMEARFQ